ncbi:MAG: glycosyltransferase family 4 protein [Candidatus Hodarchaeota archaeon]
MKILQISPFLEQQYGGTERYCFNLSRFLALRGHEVHIYTTKLRRSDPSIEEKSGIIIHRFYAPKVIWNINPAALMIHKLLKCDFDVIHVHSHLYLTSIQAAISRRIRKKPPMVIHLHGGIGPPPTYKLGTLKILAKTLFDRTLARFTINSADAVFSISGHDREYAIKTFNINKDKILVIPNCVDVSLFCPSTLTHTGPEKLIYIGDLELWKGISYLIKAIEKLNETGHKAFLTIVGDGDYRNGLEKKAHGLPIRFLGQQNHERIPQLLQKSSILVLPSLWEGIPTVALEAMASGIPVIATNVGGVSEIVTNEKTGILVRPKNADDIAQAVIRLSKSSSLRNTLRKNALRLVQNKHNFEKMVPSVERIYDLLARR